MQDYRRIIFVILIIVVMSFIFLNVVIPSQEDTQSVDKKTTSKTQSSESVSITPSSEVGKGIRTLKDDNTGYLASITDESGDVYYFVNRSTMLSYYEHVKGNYSATFTAKYRNGTVNGDNSSHIITRIL